MAETSNVTKSDSAPQKHTYTVLIATPSPKSSITSSLRQSKTKPIFAGEGATFYNRKNPFPRPFSHVLIVPHHETKEGEDDDEWLNELRLKYRWSLNITSNDLFDGKTGPARSANLTVEVPDVDDGLKKAVGSWKRKRGDRPEKGKLSRLYVLSFVTFGEDENEENGCKRYEERLYEAKDNKEFGMLIHLCGGVTLASPMEELDASGSMKKTHQVEEPHLFTLTSFPSANHYALFCHHFSPQTAKTFDKEASTVSYQEWAILTLYADPKATKEAIMPSPKKRKTETESLRQSNPYENKSVERTVSTQTLLSDPIATTGNAPPPKKKRKTELQRLQESVPKQWPTKKTVSVSWTAADIARADHDWFG